MKSHKTLKMISVIATVCLLQVYTFAGATAPNVVATDASATTDANGMMLGRLMLSGTESILVNGNSANSGTTLLSGSQLQTPEGVEATVQLGSAGKLYIQPKTNLTVTFDKTSVDVKVAAGSAFVAANAGVASSVTNPAGKTSTTGGEPGTPQPGRSNLTGGEKVAIGFVIVAGVIIIIYLIVRDDGSPS